MGNVPFCGHRVEGELGTEQDPQTGSRNSLKVISLCMEVCYRWEIKLLKYNKYEEKLYLLIRIVTGKF